MKGRHWDELTNSDIKAIKTHELDSWCPKCQQGSAALMFCIRCGYTELRYLRHEEQRKETFEYWCGTPAY